MAAILRSWQLVIILLLGSLASLSNATFDQLQIFQYPFFNETATSFIDSLYDANGYCFVTLSKDGRMWSSRLIFPQVRLLNKQKYDSFKLVHNFEQDINGTKLSKNETFEAFVKAPDSIIVITSNRMIEIVMDYSCSYLVSYAEHVYYTQKQELITWGNVRAVTASPWALFMCTSMGIFQVEFNQGVDASGIWGISSLNQYLMDTSAFVSIHYVQQWNMLFVGSESAFYELSYSIVTARNSNISESTQPVRVSHEWVGGVIGSPVLSMQYDPDVNILWVLEAQALHWRDQFAVWWREGHIQGATTQNLTSLATVCLFSDDCFVWMGTKHLGLVQHRYPEALRLRESNTIDSTMKKWDNWVLLNGPRYLQDGNILRITSDRNYEAATISRKDRGVSTNSQTVLVFTDKGLSYITTSPSTLTDKQTCLSHRNKIHRRNGFVSEIMLKTRGNLDSYYYQALDGDGIWTAQYAVAVSMQYAMTKDESHRIDVWKTFEALERLSTVTGVKGCIGVTLCSPSEIGQSNAEHSTVSI